MKPISRLSSKHRIREMLVRESIDAVEIAFLSALWVVLFEIIKMNSKAATFIVVSCLMVCAAAFLGILKSIFNIIIENVVEIQRRNLRF